MGTKRQIVKAIDLPEDALDRLYFLYKVERGLNQAGHGELISQGEVRTGMARRLK